MSDPFTGIAGLALGGLQAASSIMEAQQQAALAEANARLARQSASAEAARQRRDNARLLAAQRARVGRSGVTVEGSPVTVLSRSAAEFALGEQELVTRGLQQAAVQRFQARNARTASFLGAGQSLLRSGIRHGPSLFG